MPLEILKPLEEGKRLTPKLRRHLIKIITEDVHGICQKPGRKGLAIIAHKVVQKYMPSLGDFLYDQMVGEGHSSFLKQMEVRFDNLNRIMPYNVFKRKMKNSD